MTEKEIQEVLNTDPFYVEDNYETCPRCNAYQHKEGFIRRSSESGKMKRMMLCNNCSLGESSILNKSSWEDLVGYKIDMIFMKLNCYKNPNEEWLNNVGVKK